MRSESENHVQPSNTQIGELDTLAIIRAGVAEAESLRELLEQGKDAIPFRSSSTIAARKRLQDLSTRLEQGELHLAVVGQFKRGKSTLLNALIGARILPSAVTPMTAIPTFIRGASKIGLHGERVDGTVEDLEARDAEGLCALLTARVTEDGNPHNRLGYQRIDVLVDAPFLHQGLVLIDTPGVGSTFRHNTDAAKAVLPECDMALFVVSPDPPITEVELSYLADLKTVTRNIVVVLNKIDLVDSEDRVKSEKFLSKTVVEAAGLTNIWFFSVSARNALQGKLSGEKDQLLKSGLPTLESYLTNFARTGRKEALETALSSKAAAILRDIAFEVETRLAVYRIPIADLTDKLALFTSARKQFEKEREIFHDILLGDRTRLLADLDVRAAMLREAAKGDLQRDIDSLVSNGVTETEIAQELQRRIPERFQSQFEEFESDARGILKVILRAHQEKGDLLIANVRRLASKLLDIPFTAPGAEEAFQAKKTPYWVTAPRESLIPLPNVIDAILPKQMREERLRERLKHQVDDVVIRNVENLRWAIRQNLENSIRDFQSQLDDRLRLSQDATSLAIEEGLRRRSAMQANVDEEIARLEEAKDRLLVLSRRLEQKNEG